MTWPSALRKPFSSLKPYRRALAQGSTLFGAKMGAIGIGVLIKGIQTRALSPELYGLYAFFATLTTFTALFFRFGYFTSLKVLLANTKERQKAREYFALGIGTGLGIGGIFVLFLVIISFLIEPVFKVEIGWMLRVLAPLCLVFPLQHLVQDLAVGSNHIHKLAAYDLMAKGLYLLPLASLFWLGSLSLFTVLWLNLASALVATGVVFWFLKPSFKNLQLRLGELRVKQRTYGRHYYLGNLANQSTFKMDELLISYLINTTQLGFYSLANLICGPMVFLSQAFSSALFKDFAQYRTIPVKVVTYNAIWLLSATAVLWLVSDWVVNILFGPAYSAVADYIALLAVAHLFQGLYQPFTFLSAKSWGKAVRNVSIGEALINIFGNIFLIYFYGVYGAIITSIVAKLVHFLGLWYYYQQYRNQLTDQANGG